MNLVYISIVLCYLVGILGLILYSRLQGSIRLLILFAFVSGTMDVIGMYVGRHFGNNHSLFNVYIIIEFLLLLFALKDFLGRSFKWIALIEILVFAAAYLFEWRINGFGYFMRHTIITYMAMLAVNHLIMLGRTLTTPQLRSTGVYIISISGLIYYICVIPRFGLHKSLSAFDLGLDRFFQEIAIAVDILRFLATAAAFYVFARAGRPLKAAPGLADRR